METRRSTRRAAAPPASAPPAPAQTRKRKPKNTTAPASSASGAQPAKAAGRNAKGKQQETERPAPAARDPPPRRGARAASHAPSIASVGTRMVGESDEEEEAEELETIHFRDPIAEEEDEAEAAGVEQVVRDGAGSRDAGFDDEEDEETRMEIMTESLPDLLHASEDLIKFLQKDNHDNPVFRRMLKLKRNTFHSVREVFEDHDQQAPFIDWSAMSELDRRAKLVVPSATIVAQTNLATVLNSIEHVQYGDDVDVSLLLTRLDEAFPRLFTTAEYPQGTSSLALDIRTSLVVNMIAEEQDSKKGYLLIKSGFCEDVTHNDLPRLFSEGPFRPLLDHHGSTVEAELCSGRITEIIKLIKKPKQLQAKFALDGLLTRLKEWVRAAHARLSTRAHEYTEGRVSARPESQSQQQEIFHDAEEQLSAIVRPSPRPQSQPIERFEEGEHTLFRGASSLRFLNDQARRRSDIPPSNQQIAALREAAPRDYPQHSNEDILRGMSPAQPQQRTASPSLFVSDDEDHRSRSAPRPSVQRGQTEDHDDENEEDEDEDPFEEDPREVRAGKRAEIQAAIPAAKRQRTGAHPSSSSTTTNMPPPPIPSNRQQHPSSSPRSSLPGTSLTQRQQHPPSSTIASTGSALPLFPDHRKRFPWTERDCARLLDLIARYHAGWATIKRVGGFEYPREQLGYRDKARNMKVEYLTTDKVLPPGFDSVCLGRKEIERLISLGKNPFRREMDLDEWSRPFGTEYVPESTG